MAMYFAAGYFYLLRRIIYANRKPYTGRSGINFIGFYGSHKGLGAGLRNMLYACQSIGLPCAAMRWIHRLNQGQNLDHLPVSQYGLYRINCFVVNPDFLYRIPQWFFSLLNKKKYNVAIWFWELPLFPKSWMYATHLIDEIWVHTEFVAQIMRTTQLPVFKIAFAVQIDQQSLRCLRQDLALEDDTFLFIFTFDLASHISRKNPQAVIQAFLLAFPDRELRVALLIKVSGGHHANKELHELYELIAKDQRIRIICANWSTTMMHSLLATCDCYISLHRSEGLGLGMAEAMYLGKPVIATAYSGNMEYMNAKNSALVPYKLVPVKAHEYPHADGQSWANPSIEIAAQLMQRMVFDGPWRSQIAKHAKQYMHEHHSLEKMGKDIQNQLKRIDAGMRQAGCDA